MKYLNLLLALWLLALTAVQAQKTEFFPEEELMSVGVYYYPEHWNPDQWERDIKNIADHGFEFIHAAEFAWAQMEPTEGQYDFAWLDKVVELAGKNNLKVILGTPSACPPVWLGKKHPDIYIMDANYQRKEHGTRANFSVTNKTVQGYTSKIVAELAKHYANNPHVMGWQIDNEPEAKQDYSPSAQAAFRVWLQSKYGSIDSLNFAWGMRFWSQLYSTFDEVDIHNATSVGWWGANPIALLDFRRFTADKQGEFLDMQADELRKHISKKQFVTTNYVAKGFATDPRRSKAMDFASFTAYPNYGSDNMGELGFRMGDYSVLLYANDYYRSLNQVTGVMELQPGQVNWANYNALLQPGTVRMWLWHCFAGGSSFACTYRYRQVLYGAEQFHAGIVTTDGVSLSPGGKEYVQVIKEMQDLRKKYSAKAKMPKALQQRKTAIMWDFDNFWNLEKQKQTYAWSTWGHLQKYQTILNQLGAPVAFITEDDQFEDYDFIVVPAYQLVDSALVSKWKAYVAQGGNLLVSCRTGAKDKNNHLWESNTAGIMNELIGGKIMTFDMLGNKTGKVTMDGKDYPWSTWGEQITPDADTEVLATYTDQFYKGAAGCLKHKLGKGTLWYIGIDTQDGELEKAIATKMYTAKGLSTENWPAGVLVYWRDGFRVAVNYSSTTHTLDVKGKFVVGSEKLPPAGVSVWVE